MAKRQSAGLPRPGADEVLFVALGGSGEIGMNLYAYGHDGHWLITDMGVSFGDDSNPGIDVIVPDIEPLLANPKSIVGIMVTHAHEDHVGAIAHLWERVRCPIVATPFAKGVIDRKLDDAGLYGEAKVTKINQGGRANAGPFGVEFIPVSHSIPEACALAIHTSAGTLIHTGDWKLDDDPVIGTPTDVKRLQELGDEGVLAVIADSTNAMNPGHSPSEGATYDGLLETVAEQEGRVVVTCFASNVARVATLARVAEATGRTLCMVGRSLHRMTEIADSVGHLPGFPDPVDEQHIMQIPREKTLIVATGSQGEYRAALAKISRQEHPMVKLEEGDTVIFSSRVIPGNENVVGQIKNDLAAQGVKIIEDGGAEAKGRLLHASGHPHMDELVSLYQWTRPKIVLPVHGELQHQMANAAIALDTQVAQTLVGGDGDLIQIKNDRAKIVQRFDLEPKGLDGRRLISLYGGTMSDRRRMMYNGQVSCAVVVKRDGEPLADPVVKTEGLLEAHEVDTLSEAQDWAWDSLDRMSREARKDNSNIEQAVAKGLRRYFRDMLGKRPQISVLVTRV